MIFMLLSTIFVVSCESGSKNNNRNGGNSERETGSLYGECYPDKTCSEDLVCDEENNVCIKNPGNPACDADAEPSETDSEIVAEDDADITPDDGDSAHEDDADTTPDEGDTVQDDDTDTTPDEGDTVQDDDTGTTPDDGDPAHDDDSDKPADPCDPNPCDSSNVQNATGECFATGDTTYYCGCKTGYSWVNSHCRSNSPFGRICTGQDKCYKADGTEITCPVLSADDFYGQDAQYTDKCTAQSFEVITMSGRDVVVDKNTGLVWQQSPSEDPGIWDDATGENSPCAKLNGENYAGISTWRVPNPLELLSIVDNGTYYPAVNTNFKNMPVSDATDFYLWTSKEYKGNTNNAYYFSPSYGWCRYDGAKTKKYKVMCVSGNELVPAAADDFEVSADGKTVTDKRTGLMWQKRFSDSTSKWEKALQYCAEAYAGYDDWRLPNKNELASLLNYDKSEAPYSDFPDISGNFWTSSTYLFNTGRAWNVHFADGNVSLNFKSYNMYYAVCVR